MMEENPAKSLVFSDKNVHELIGHENCNCMESLIEVQKVESGMGTTQMVDWTRQFLDRQRDDGPSVLTMHRLGCRRNRTILKQL
jgi:hypothetical protein